MKRFIVIPLYDHTTPNEALEICEALEAHQFAQKPYICTAQFLPGSPYVLANTWTKHVGAIPE